MDFKQFALSRDLLYLAALLLGAGLGCMLNRFRRKASTRFRNSSVTAGLCLFSLAFSALIAACIISNWMIVKEASLYLPMGILSILLVLACRFPKAAGFPILIVSGLLLVWIAYACLRFPLFNSAGEGYLVRNGDGLVLFRLISPPGSDSEQVFSFLPEDEGVVIEFHALNISISKEIPLIGGENRGIIAEITGGGEPIYTNSRFNKSVFPFNYSQSGEHRIGAIDRLIFFGETLGKLVFSELLPGISHTIKVDETGFSFQ